MNGFDLSGASAIYVGSTQAQSVYIGSTLLWPQQHDYSRDYFTIESLQDNNTITAVKNGSSKSPVIYYSLDDGQTWSNQTLSSGTITFGTINTGEKIIFKCSIDSWASDWNQYNRFNGSKNFKVYGNAMSLLFSDNFLSNSEFSNGALYCLCGLFYGTTTIIDAQDLILPASTCVQSCYNGMFRGATNLAHGPNILPATTSAWDCYSSMFEGCINLEEAPIINLENASTNCCKRMFCMNRSSKITTPKLTKGPVLRIDTLSSSCFSEMFKGNGNLVEVTCLATSSISNTNTDNWLTNCSSSGTFYKNPNASWGSGTSAIPSGWTTLNYSVT